MSKFPKIRMRRLRSAGWIRNLVSETNLTVDDLILPLFVTGKESEKTLIESLPDISRLGEEELLEAVERASSLGVNAVALFPVIPEDKKDEKGSYAYNEGNFLFSRIAKIKEKFPDMGVIADVALDPYTTHGHDGILDMNGYVANDITNEALVKQSLALAKAGVDVVAPSDMMDGRVGKIREALEEEGYENVIILSYAAKYASALYGPFRDAVGSAKNLAGGNKNTYQMSPLNVKEAVKEVKLDIDEGADIVLVKPASFYQDVIRQVRDNFDVPLFAYQVSGEYSMMKFAARNGIVDFNNILLESVVSIKRSGADAIITYGALEIAELLNDDD